MSNETGGDPSNPVDIGQLDAAKADANIQGFVFDENTKAVEGALVKVGGKTAVTNAYGLFSLQGVNTSINNTVITIEKAGYFRQVKSKRIAPGDDNFIKAQLISRLLTGAFTASTGGNINVPGGGSIKFQPNSIKSSGSGAAYSGKVHVFSTWLDPSDVNILYRMPGDLRGVTSSGTERMLITYGMMKVELESEAGEKLQLDSTRPADLVFPVPVSLLADAPTSIPMWHFDEEKGRWMEEGASKLAANTYTTKVRHFSWWNCDIPYDQPLINYCVLIIDENGDPYTNAHVLVRRPNDSWGAHGYTNGEGFVCGRIPSNTPLKLEILGEVGCEQAILSTPIGPYRTDVKSDTVVVRRNPEKTITVSGKAVDCNNQPVQSGYIQAVIGSNGYLGTIENGQFRFTVVRCPSENSVTLFGYDEATNRLSDEKEFRITGNNVNAGTIMVCGKPENTINNSLVAFYPLDGDARDLSGKDLHGQMVGKLTPVQDRFGKPDKALYFANDTATIRVPNTDRQNLLPFSVSLWVKMDEDAPTNSTIFGKYSPGLWNGFMVLYVKDTGAAKSSISPWYINSTQNRILGDYGEPPFQFGIETSKWVHCVFTVDYDGAKVYLNGKFMEARKWTGTASPSTNNLNWVIGGYYNNRFKGSLDDIRVYNRALLDFEVKYLFEN